MAGKVRAAIERIIAARAQGDPAAAHFMRTKLILKGIHPDHFTEASPDDPNILEKLAGLEDEIVRGSKP
jgi:hypothetical protein